VESRENELEKAVLNESENAVLNESEEAAGEHDEEKVVPDFVGHDNKFEDVSASMEKLGQV